MANRIPEMPQDLRNRLAQSDLCLHDYEQPQPDLVFEEIRTGLLNSTAFFPVSSNTEKIFPKPAKTPMMVLFIIPGGFEEVNSGDQNLCIYLAKKTGGICVATSHPSGTQNGIRSMKKHCRSVFETVRNLCDTAWKAGWGTDSSNIVIVASSFGAVLAMDLLETFSVLALGLIVPLFDTNPSSKQNPWGKNGDVPGLDTHYLLSSLDETFKGVSRDDWHNNPSKMPDFVRVELPPMCIAIAEFDPLYLSGKEFADQQKVLVEHRVFCRVFKGIHKVKDMDQDTAEGHNLREYLVECFYSFFASGNSVWPHWLEQLELLL